MTKPVILVKICYTLLYVIQGVVDKLVKIQCIVGASLSIIYETSHRIYILIAHKHVSCMCHESNLQALR